MKRVTLIATACVVAVLALLSIKVGAQDFNPREKTFLTFSNTVEMPGVTLPAGTYVFKLADTDSRNVVQVMSRDEKNILGQWLFVQAERPEVTNDTVVMFKESKEGATPAVQYWYYPGERTGKEFVYPKEQAIKIAARTGQQVKSTEGDIAANSTVSSVDSQGKVTEWQREKTTASSASADVSPADPALRDAPAASQPTAAAGSLTGNRGVTPEPSQSVGTSGSISADAQAVGTSGSADAQPTDTPQSTSSSTSAPAPTTQTARAELPRTASPVPLTGLIGLMSLFGAFCARAAAVRR